MARYIGVLGALLLVSACVDSVPEARLTNHDRVMFLHAKRGHEIVVRKGGKPARIRLVGIYAFNAGVRRKNDISTYADMALGFWDKRFAGQELTIMLERAEPDPRGRFLGYLYDGDEDISSTLLKKGLVTAYTEFPFRRESDYFAAEAEARASTSGLWASELAVERTMALRDTWSTAQHREFGTTPKDPVLGKGAAQ